MKRCNLIKRYFIGLLQLSCSSLDFRLMHRRTIHVKVYSQRRTRQGMQDSYDAECATQVQAQDMQASCVSRTMPRYVALS